MKISDMEALLQQEMEAVKGGSGTVRGCICISGAFAGEPGGSCECETAAEAYSTVSCNCSTGAIITGGLINPPGGLDCLIGLSR